MKYSDFEAIITRPRMGRYLAACGGDTRKAMTLYRKNLRLSQELFTVISCLEIALRNAIDMHYSQKLGAEWLKNAIHSGGVFDNSKCRLTQTNINDAIRSLNHTYTHYKLIAEMGFGFWRYMFANHQFMAAGSINELNLEDKDLLINASPIGMKLDDPLLLNSALLHKNLFVYDLIYNPPETKLLKLARENGLACSNGLGMLLYQGVEALSLWISPKKVPVDLMRKALKKGSLAVRKGE